MNRSDIKAINIEDLSLLDPPDSNLVDFFQDLDQKKITLSFEGIFMGSRFFEEFTLSFVKWDSLQIKSYTDEIWEEVPFTELNGTKEGLLDSVCEFSYTPESITIAGLGGLNSSKWVEYTLVCPIVSVTSYKEVLSEPLQFTLERNNQTQIGDLIYDDEKRSFSTTSSSTNSLSSVLVNNLHLEIDSNATVHSLKGKCTFALYEYKMTSYYPQNPLPQNLRLHSTTPPSPHVCFAPKELRNLPCFVNREKGWVILGNPSYEKGQQIEFLPNCIATIDEGQLKALWLKPKQLPYWEFIYKGE